MADAPFNRQLSAGFTNPHLRAINNEYHLEPTAKNTADIRAGLVAQTRLQYEAAAANQRARGLVHEAIENRGAEMRGGLDVVSSELRYMNGQSDRIDDTLVEGFDTLNASLHAGFSVVVGELVNVIRTLRKQQLTLDQLARTRSLPFESNWMEGVLLLAVYAILGLTFFWIPGVADKLDCLRFGLR